MEMNLTARPEFLSDNIQFLALNHDFPHISSIKRSTDAFFCGASESQQRSRRIPTNRWAGSHVRLGATRSCALPGGRGGAVSFWTRLILDSWNLRRRSQHLNHSAEPSQLRLCFYDFASFFGVSTKTGRHRDRFQIRWRQRRILRFKAL